MAARGHLGWHCCIVRQLRCPALAIATFAVRLLEASAIAQLGHNGQHGQNPK
jgi:hypothetical protein